MPAHHLRVSHCEGDGDHGEEPHEFDASRDRAREYLDPDDVGHDEHEHRYETRAGDPEQDAGEEGDVLVQPVQDT